MLKSLGIRNLTVFAEADLQFSPQLNVIIGENGTGKSHLLKIAYSMLAVSAEEGRKPNSQAPTKAVLQTRLAEKLVAVFRPESLGRLARRQQGRARCGVKFKFGKTGKSLLNTDFSFATQNKSEVTIDRMPKDWVSTSPVFLPTRELLTIYPGFIPMYDSHYLEFEETWRDTCVLLGIPLVRDPRDVTVKELLVPLERAMGGKVVLEKTGRFYLNIPNQGNMEIPLVAEGLRKLATLARLIATGSLLGTGYLFWDEPEANLNPKLVKVMASTILHLCRSGVQVFIATHSLFLMRELHIQLQSDEFQRTEARFFGLHIGSNGVDVTQGNSIDDIGEIASLDEELEQSDRYLEI